MITSSRRRRRTTVAVAALLVTATLSACAGPASGQAAPDDAWSRSVGRLPHAASAWPSAQYDARHSSGTTAVGPQQGVVRWSRSLHGNLTPGPVIGVDGSILVASNAGVLQALDPATGATRWSVDAGGSYGVDLSTSPTVLADGTILWPGPRSTLWAISATGQKRWSVRLRGQVLSPAAAGADRVYVADTRGDLVALSVRGSSHRVAWRLALGGQDDASPSVGPDGTIYTASDHDLVAVRDGRTRGVVSWRFATRRLIEVSNGVSPAGIVVVGTNGDREYGVDRHGHAAWSIPIGDWTYSSSAVRPDGTAYFADNSGRVRAVDSRTGKVLRVQQPAAPKREHAWSSVVVDARGDTYWATQNGNVYGYGPDGRQLWTLHLDAGLDAYPALGADGALYLGDEAGRFYAIGGGTPTG